MLLSSCVQLQKNVFGASCDNCIGASGYNCIGASGYNGTRFGRLTALAEPANCLF